MAEGKAAEVYAATLSEGGKAVFDAAGVKYAYGVLTKEIINRRGDGPCPMETLSAGVVSGEVMRAKIRAFFADK